MTFTSEETQFVKFLESFQQFYMESHKIAENKKGVSILPNANSQNDFKMYSLDDICHSSKNFHEGGLTIIPKTTDAIWYKKEGDNFYIFLIEFKGDYLCKNPGKCKLVDSIVRLRTKNKKYNNDLIGEINSLEKVVPKFTDKMLNNLSAKPLETVTIAIPLLYEEYYEKNKNNEGVEYMDIRSFLFKSRIIYRIVSFANNFEPNRQKTRGNSYRCSVMIPSVCKKYAKERHDTKLSTSYESSLLTYHKRYEKAGIIFDSGFIDNYAFANFIKNYLK